MKKLAFSILVILGLLFLSGCYQWLSNSEVTGMILAINCTEFEAIADFQPEGYQEGKLVHIRFQLADEERCGYDRDLLESLQLTGKNCYVKLGPHGVVHQCVLFLLDGNYEIPKIE